MSAPSFEHRYEGTKTFVLSKWKVEVGSRISPGTVILTYSNSEESSSDKGECNKMKSTVTGTVQEILLKEGDLVRPNDVMLRLESCKHEVIMKDLCAECGADLRQLGSENLQEVVASRSFSMVHVVPELKCSLEQAKQLDEADEARLLKGRKLILLVDLDQTLIHTTNESVLPDLKNVHHFQLYGPRSPWYHTKLRPHTKEFLEKISQLYELHIFTFGARMYAHKIANILDKDGKLFSHRILSRDECFDATSKTGNLKSLFPRGDFMVCIIDDREDIWNFAPNVVHVKPYVYFRNTGDINSPPGMNNRRLADQNNSDNNTNQVTTACADTTTSSDVQMETENQEQKPNDVPENDDKKAETDSSSEVKQSKSDASCNEDSTISSTSEQPEISNICDSSSSDFPEQSSEGCEARPAAGELLLADKSADDSLESGEVRNDEDDDDDDFLLYLEEILVRIHKAYYELYDEMEVQESSSLPDLKNVIPYVKKKILQGVNIVFSGVIPMNLDPEKSSVWLLAQSLGANIFHDIQSKQEENPTTHLIASRMGTSKLNKAKRMGNIHIVTPNWLFCCGMRWERVDERLFPLKKNSSPEVIRKCKKLSSKKARDSSGSSKTRDKSSSSQSKDDSDDNDDSQGAADIPLSMLHFSSEELENMDKEIEEACATDSSEGSCNSDCSVSSQDTSEPRGKKRFSDGDFPNQGKKFKDDGDDDVSRDGIGWCHETTNSQPSLNSSDSNDSSNSRSSSNTLCSEDEALAAAVEKELFDS